MVSVPGHNTFNIVPPVNGRKSRTFAGSRTISAWIYSSAQSNPRSSISRLQQNHRNALGLRVVGTNDELQTRIQKCLQENPDYCFVFDEAEYLTYGNANKIDVIRQIYDETQVPIVICGTYLLKDLISGDRKKNSKITHNRPQIFRRLRKEAFTSLKPEKETKLDIDKPVDGTKFSETSATSGNKKESASTPDTPYVDVSTLHPATIDIATYKDALCHKMSM